MNVPPPILENFYNQGGDDNGDDHEHEDELNLYTQWRLATTPSIQKYLSEEWMYLDVF